MDGIMAKELVKMKNKEQERLSAKLGQGIEEDDDDVEGAGDDLEVGDEPLSATSVETDVSDSSSRGSGGGGGPSKTISAR